MTTVVHRQPGRSPAHPVTVSRPRDSVAGHIAGLDGLRAVAVIAVVVYHLWPNRLPGGFIGVDLFFVISGFLITTLLVRERRTTGRVDLLDFWRRRARRLLPALLVVIVASIVAARVVDGDLLVGIDRQALGGLTFSSNWLEARAGTDYFDATAPMLFGTFWSLAVEEQFYLFWPLAAIAIKATMRRGLHRVRLTLGIALASAVLMAAMYRPGENPTRVYYGTDTHLFGLMLGAALAFGFASDVGVLGEPRWQRVRRWAGFVGLGGLIAAMFVIHSSSAWTYRGGLAVAAVLGAVAVAALPGSPSAYTRLNGLRPLEWIGQRSYGIYLWHWPVILIVAAVHPVPPGEDPPASVAVTVLAITVALAAASYRWIETPVRRDGFGVLTAAVQGRPWVTLGSVGFVMAAMVIVATAPATSSAQLAVERGQLAIDAQATAVASDVGTDPAATPTPAAEDQTASQPAPAPEVTVPPPVWSAGEEVPPGEMIIGFGDSVLSGAAPAMYERFPGIRIDAKPIRQWKAAPDLVRSAIDDGSIRQVVVLNFGTNAGLESEESRAALISVLDLLGPSRRVVLVNTVGTSRWVPSTNALLAEIAAGYPNTIVADWHSVVATGPGLVHSDRTHPNMEGIEVYADLVATALAQLGPG